MADSKYYAGIRSAQAAQAAEQNAGNSGGLPPFDFSSIEPKTRLAAISGRISQKMLVPIYAYSRAFKPIMPLAGLVHVTRDAQVRDVLNRSQDFPSPFGLEMEELGEGSTFLLGLDGPEHTRLRELLWQIVKQDDVPRIARMSGEFTEGLLENSGGRIDVVADILKRVPAEICVRYFGLTCHDVTGFSDWVMSISAMLFGDPYGNPEVRALAMNGAARVRAIIADSLRRAQNQHDRVGPAEGPDASLIERLVVLQRQRLVSEAEIKAIVMGMIAGFIPTNTLASAKILEELLRRPEAWAMARKAAQQDDRDTMLKVVLEASRLNPALAPGQWRYCPYDAIVDVDGRAHTIKSGSTLLVSNLSALRDKRVFAQPNKFRIDRTNPDGTWQKPDLVYGLGPHSCVGEHLANAQITALFMALMKQRKLRCAKGKSGRMQSIGPFPRSLTMTFDTPASQQSMFLIIAPVAKGLKLAEFARRSHLAAFGAFLKSRNGLLLTIPLALGALLFGIVLHRMFPTPIVATWAEDALRWAGIGIGALALGLATPLTIGWAFFAAIRRAESSDWIDEGSAALPHIETLAQQEDSPGYAQNHILAVGEIKPGMLRSLAHAFALWAIRMIIIFAYRPGFVINMGTIHYARWWRVPGTNRTAFYSNFDGSWESYLEDFITRARWGQTAVWSNWKGFPPTRYLMFSGAQNGDLFKRWVRKHQQVVPFWYSRFPGLSTDQIRNNAMIHSGVAHARTASEAAEWLRCFGSMPKVANLIETDEVQALVFSGMKRLKVSTCLVLKLPTGDALGEWLAWIRGETQTTESFDEPQTKALVAAGILLPVETPQRGYCLSQSLTLTFGDRPLVGEGGLGDPALSPDGDQMLTRADAARMHRRAIHFACSAKGIDRFDSTLTESFSAAFRMGMAKRGRQMGDHGAQSSANWRWTDGGNGAEAVMLIYAETTDDLAYVSEVHASLIENFGGAVINRIDCAPANPDASHDRQDIEHFGYRDGISQPVIKGTARALRNVPERDLIEPGEFILGYASGQGFFPPSPLVGPEKDIAGYLPTAEDGVLNRFPDFGAEQYANAPRDLGRNGSYLVIRELAQDVQGFEAFTERKAAELRGACPATDDQSSYRDLYKTIGQHPDKDWVKAKLMGRWPNGRPLIGHPLNMPLSNAEDMCARAAEKENDFSFGTDDPQGLACPFGSHIRRCNPRDSKQPGDAAEQVITNRHRLLRRGRSYVRPDKEKGLLFMALCADLERQFEFVQQVWAVSPSFHGLAHEPDPVIGSDLPDPNSINDKMLPRTYSIPTPAGPVKLTGMQSFVTTKAGGYFFLPSRSALAFLTDVALSHTGKTVNSGNRMNHGPVQHDPSETTSKGPDG